VRRAPKARGVAVDAARMDGWVERFAGYREHVSKARIQKWLSQFENHHKDAAARVLDVVEFFREDHLASAFRSVFGKLSGWSKKSSDRRGQWRFVGFGSHAGESGDRMLNTFRRANGLASARYSNLFIHPSQLLEQNLTAEDTVVFVDDFTGTGNQAVTAWNESLSELLPARPRVFLVLAAAASDAVKEITEKTPMKVEYFRRLRGTDNFFASGFTHFTTVEKASILSYCQRADNVNPKGYCTCGLLLVFSHRCPNNSIPILHSTNPAFRGLFPR